MSLQMQFASVDSLRSLTIQSTDVNNQLLLGLDGPDVANSKSDGLKQEKNKKTQKALLALMAHYRMIAKNTG